jgi:hypothetical protein
VIAKKLWKTWSKHFGFAVYTLLHVRSVWRSALAQMSYSQTEENSAELTSNFFFNFSYLSQCCASRRSLKVKCLYLPDKLSWLSWNMIFFQKNFVTSQRCYLSWGSSNVHIRSKVAVEMPHLVRHMLPICNWWTVQVHCFLLFLEPLDSTECSPSLI